MDRTAPQLLDTIEALLTEGASALVVGECLRWRSAISDPAPLWRAASLALRQLERDEHAERVLQGAAMGALRRGRLLDAVDAARRLETMDRDAAQVWRGIEDALHHRPFGPSAPGVRVGMPDAPFPTGDVSESCDALVALADAEFDIAEHAELERIPLIDALEKGALPWLERLQLRASPAASRLLGPKDGAAWMLFGALSGDPPAAVQRGTLLMAREGIERRASSVARLLVLSHEDLAAMREEPRVRRADVAWRRRQLVVRTLASSSFFQVLARRSRERLLASAKGVIVDDQRLIHKDTHAAGLFVVVDGLLRVLDTEGRLTVQVAQLGPGDVVGEFDVLTGDGTNCHVDVVGRAHLLHIDGDVVRAVLDDDPDAARWIEDLAERRREQVAQLDTGEVVLIDD